jgi:cystathionine beta-lyase/cystathionine gamma-synthase
MDSSLSLIQEIKDVILLEREKICNFESDLAKLERCLLNTKSKSPMGIIEQVISDLRIRINDVYKDANKITDFIETNKNDFVPIFNQISILLGYFFRKSVSVRTSLLRHTPTLSGQPLALDPNQNHLLSPGNHTVEYGRGGYFLYQDETVERVVYKDHPILAREAREICDKLYEDKRLKATLFSCGLGAINTYMDFIKASQTGAQKSYYGKHCWIEVKKYISENYSDTFSEIDDLSLENIVSIFKKDDTFSIALETIVNHPDMPVIDLNKFIDTILSQTYTTPKFLLIDNVSTPDFNLFDKYFHKRVPKNLCIASVISGVKFLQAGLDISKSGLLIMLYNQEDFATDPFDKIIEVRGGSGRVLSTEEAFLANIETRNSFYSRLARMDQNVKELANLLDDSLRAHKLGYISSPWLQSHPYHEIAKSTYNCGGKFFYIRLGNQFDRKRIQRIYRLLPRRAEEENICLMSASSFGMSSPHIHLVMHPECGPTIRLSPGSTDPLTNKKLCKVVIDTILDAAVEVKSQAEAIVKGD